MKTELLKNQLIQDTIRVTTEMGANYPELYHFLDETPISIYVENNNEVCSSDFEKYLSTIKHQLRNHIATHRNSFAPTRKNTSL